MRVFIIILIALLIFSANIISYFIWQKPLHELLLGDTEPQVTVAPPQAEQPAPPTPLPPKPEPQPAPQPAPAPQPPAPRKPAERAHSVEHAAVLQVTQAVQPEAQEAELEQLVEKGQIAPEAAQTLREWAKEHPDFKVEEVGIVQTEQESGEKETRYRLVSNQGGQDILVSVTTPKQGKPVITKVEQASSDRTQVTAQSDPLTVVEGFVEALKRGDMGTARRLTSGGDISDATLAGLCIMFEEGDFTMRKKIPIRNMFKNNNNAGYIIYMTSNDPAAQAGNVGIEMSYDPEKGWGVKAVAMDNLLGRYETSGAAEGGVYFPLVKNPQGGDSLVLYFSFNDATPSPRSLSQLRIVANILKKSNGTLNISGHTDDVGTAEYNQQLSERRALAVKEALIAYGVREDQITTKGMGKSQPRRTYHLGDTRETIRTIRSGNRRAEIYLDF